MADPSYLRYVPYDHPYDHQLEAMETIAQALDTGEDVLFEGATGTGKTLAALAPALEFASTTDKTVVITTNVHQQMRQFRREASAIAAQEPIRAVVFRGKSSMCHIDVGYDECQALRETTRELVDTERSKAELERRQRDLLEQSQAGTGEASAKRGTVLDELDELDAELATLSERATCEYYYRNMTADTDDFFGWLYDDVRSPDEIYGYAEEHGFCGYELLKEGLEGIDLVVCNYHHLLDGVIRDQFFRWLGREPEDIIAVFDEAHNVESAARDHARRRLAESTLDRALAELKSIDDARTVDVSNLFKAYHTALGEICTEADHSRSMHVSGTDWTDISIANDDRPDDLTLAFFHAYSGRGYKADLETALSLGEELDRQYDRAYRNGETETRKECPTRQAATFLESWFDLYDEPGMYPVASVRRQPGGSTDTTRSEVDSGSGSNRSTVGRAELYTCIPRRVTAPLFDNLYASVLMSATLRPFDVTEDVLGLSQPRTLAYGPQFPADRRRTYVVDGPSLFARNRDDESVTSVVTQVLSDTAEFTPGNTLAFFPSYAEASRYHDRFSDHETFLDEPGTPAHELRAEFAAADNAILCTSLWGTLAEGVSFDGDDARTVIVVGVPYPKLDDRINAVQDAYDVAFGDRETQSPGWRYAVEIPTIRKTRQALGRVIRSPDDFGVRVLLDGRYSERATIEEPEYAVRGVFPPEERAEMIDIEPAKLKYGLVNFYADMEAYGDDPPSP